MDLRGVVPYPSHKWRFVVLESAYVISASRHKQKRELETQIMQLRNDGHSLREIGQMVGLHWTRVWQVLR